MPRQRQEDGGGVAGGTVDRTPVPPPSRPTSVPAPSRPVTPAPPRTRTEPAGPPAAPIIVSTPVFDVERGVLKRSSESHEVFFDTIYDDFSLTAQPVYNFYVTGEESDESERTVENPEEYPRYVFLRWFPPPNFAVEYEMTPRGSRTDRSRNVRSFNVSGLAFNYDDVFSFPEIRRMWANSYLDVGFVEMRTAPPARPEQERQVVDEELYLASGLKVPILDLVSNDRGPPPPVAYDPYGSEATAVTEDVDPLAELKLDLPRGVDERTKIKASLELLLDRLTDGAVDAVATRESAEVTLAVAGAAGEISLLASVRDAIRDYVVEPPSIPSPSDLPEVEYIGYLIEKHVLGEDGAFQFRDVVEIPDISKTFYIDQKVAYGQVVRYRVLTVFRWTREPSVRVVEGASFRASSGVRPILQKSSTILYSSWSNYATAVVLDKVPPNPPERLFVRPLSNKGQIHVAWSFPDDSQQDITSFYLHRRRIRGDEFLTPWETIAGPLPARNGLYVDSAVEYFEGPEDGYVYAMTSTSVHDETSALSEQVFCALSRQHKNLGEKPVRWVSQPGATLDCHGACAVRPMREVDETVVAKRQLVVHPRTGPSKFVGRDGTLTVRLESLDTGETRDVALSLTNVAVEAPSAPLPPAGRIPTPDGGSF